MQFGTTRRRTSQESGYILIIFLMVLTVMMLALTAALPRLAQQIKRDREIEMVHRGDQYARAIKRYYKKTGRYPGRIEDLEKTNTIRFLRKRYKDPMSKDGAWRLVRYGEVQLGAGGTGAGVPAAQLAQGASAPGAQSGGMFNLNFSGGAGGAGANANPAITAVLGLAAGAGTASPGNASAATTLTPQTTGTTATDTSGTASTSGTTSSTAQVAPGQTTAASGGGMFSNPASSAQPGAGGGAIIGVASLNKQTGIHVFAKKTAYNEWLFLYDPAQDRGQLLRGPYNPKAYFGQFGSQTIGQPIAGQPGQGAQSGQGTGQPSGSGIMGGAYTPMTQPSNSPAGTSPGATNTPTPPQ